MKALVIALLAAIGAVAALFVVADIVRWFVTRGADESWHDDENT